MNTVLEMPVQIGEVYPLSDYITLSDYELDERICAAKETLGQTTVILGHHYQRDEIVKHADFVGDSYKLSQQAAHTDAKHIIFCGVHFMAESADILGFNNQQVILPDLNAGCSMADMATLDQVEECWKTLEKAHLTAITDGGTIPLSYMNSSAAIKGFCGNLGGLVCTSSNARQAFEWAFQRGRRILFMPEQHLGRNTGFDLGLTAREMVVWDPYLINGGLTLTQLKRAKVILWKGHCSVHQRFLPEQVDNVRKLYPDMKVIVHPECRHEVCMKADGIGSTEYLIKTIEDAPDGSSFAIGTEIHLVHRLAERFKGTKKIITLDESGCLCTTMYRITPSHLCWALENLVNGNVVNQIKVNDQIKSWAKMALDRMLEVR